MSAAALAGSGPFVEAARIGPNAIVRTVEALREVSGEPATSAVLNAAGLGHYLQAPPGDMVPQEDVTALYRSLRAGLDRPVAAAVAELAGVRTATYLLAHRIPALAQAVLRILPGRVAAPMLLAAITKHTWTFAGSARVRATAGPPVRIAFEGCPLCFGSAGEGGACGYYAATFEHLFRELVSARAAAHEAACQAAGANACVFEVRF